MGDRKRNYKKEYEQFHANPVQKKRRAQRNAARAKLEKAGKVRKGDGKDVDHISRNRNGSLNNSAQNLRVLLRSKNRARNSRPY